MHSLYLCTYVYGVHVSIFMYVYSIHVSNMLFTNSCIISHLIQRELLWFNAITLQLSGSTRVTSKHIVILSTNT